jgi:crotonobetaine/carnitine-CoA ligase
VFPKRLRAQARANGETVFLLNDDARVTHAEADAISDRLAGGMAKLGIGQGDRVATLMGNRPETVLLALAVKKPGATWVPIRTDSKGAWRVETLQRSRVALLLGDVEHVGRIEEVRGEPPGTLVVVLDGDGALPSDKLLAAEPLDAEFADRGVGDTCAVRWTPRTTGRSKGVMQSDEGWIRAITNAAVSLDQTRASDVVHCAPPLRHSGAWITCVLRAFMQGITVVIEPRSSVTGFWDRVRSFGVTQTSLLGAMGGFLWNAPQRDDADHSLRAAQIVPMPPQRASSRRSRRSWCTAFASAPGPTLRCGCSSPSRCSTTQSGDTLRSEASHPSSSRRSQNSLDCVSTRSTQLQSAHSVSYVPKQTVDPATYGVAIRVVIEAVPTSRRTETWSTPFS